MKNNKKPDILLIQVDQLWSGALASYGGASHTPIIDRLCSQGTRFENCFCQFPLCMPSRASLWSGLYPHKTNVISNGRNWPNPPFEQNAKTLGEVFTAAGYKTVHFGKQHDGGALRGFECAPEGQIKIPDDHPAWPYNMDTYADRDCREKACAFLESYDFSKPLLMAADLVNPHNICGWVGANKGLHADVPLPAGEKLPELPPNFDFDDIENRAAAIRYICCSHVRQSQAAGWTPDNFRHYIAAYHHYLTLVDAEIGLILAALEKRGRLQNTVIFFFADHGDNLAARNSVTKQVNMYEECVRVPLAVCGPGIARQKKAAGGLVALLDIAPTLCELAGIPIPAHFDGLSFYPSLADSPHTAARTDGSLSEPAKPPRTQVECQWHTEWGYTVSPSRLIRTERFKYVHYLEDSFEELYDLEKDPYEKKNVAALDEYGAALADMRTRFEIYLAKTGDQYRALSWKADKRWRSHACGYHNHSGPAAPNAE